MEACSQCLGEKNHEITGQISACAMTIGYWSKPLKTPQNPADPQNEEVQDLLMACFRARGYMQHIWATAVNFGHTTYLSFGYPLII